MFVYVSVSVSRNTETLTDDCSDVSECDHQDDNDCDNHYNHIGGDDDCTVCDGTECDHKNDCDNDDDCNC